VGLPASPHSRPCRRQGAGPHGPSRDRRPDPAAGVNGHGSSASSRSRKVCSGQSEEVGELLRSDVCLPKDRAQCPGGKVAVPVYGNDDERAAAWATQVVMASADVGLLVTRPPECPQQVPAADSWKSGQGAATSISTMSTWWRSTGIGRWSLAAASRYPRTASRVCASASSRVFP
jgi:hypothetical protein